MEKYLEFDKEGLNRLAHCISNDLANIHEGKAMEAHFPFSLNYLGSFSLEDFVTSLKELISSLDEDSLRNLVLKKKIYPSQIAQYFYFLAGSRKVLDEQTRRELSTKLLFIIGLLRKDSFCFDGKNLLRDFDVNEYTSTLQKVKETKNLNFLLQSYVELIFPTIMPLGREFHGPYLYEGYEVIVREYHSLEIFNKKVFAFLEFYLPGQSPKFDFFNHIVSNTYFPEKTFLFFDKKPLEEKELTLLTSKLLKNLKELSKKDKKYFVLSFTSNLFDSLKSIDKIKNQEKLVSSILKKIENTKLSESLINPYKGLSKEEISKRLEISFKKTFGLI